TIKPKAICASLSFVDLDSLNGAAKILASAFNNASTDNCSLGGTAYSISKNGGAFGSEVSFSCADKTPAVANHLITLRVTDASGNTSICTRQVTVRDVTKPDFKVPANVTLGCDEDQTPANTGSPTNPTDACGPVTFDPPTSAKIPGNCPNAYTLKRTWTATDGSGNKRTKTQTIVVGDNKPPTFDLVTEHIVPTDSDIFCDAAFTLAPPDSSFEDGGCGSALVISHKINYPTPSYGYQDVTTPVFSTFVGDYFPIGTTEVTFYAQDACGNRDSIVVKVIVQDKSAPHIDPTYYSDFCDRVFVIPNTPGACSNSFSWTRPNFQLGVIDDCSSELGQSALTVTETISDPALSSTLNQSIPFNFYLPGTINNFNRIFPTAQFPVGVTTVTYTATDNAGNSTLCQFVVEVTDDQAPK
ncbi:MAG TPA: HYR domain-containing protein, partial [Saprospiraceae bacterium]|nr:HYR domain-containing protein [Saprospiraceae bacterium]